MSKASEVLQSAFNADPNAIHALLTNRVPCNALLADHPHVVVDWPPVLLRKGTEVLHVETGTLRASYSNVFFQVGAIGLINGILSAIGMPLVVARFSDEVDEDGRRRLLGFCDYEPEKAGDAKGSHDPQSSPSREPVRTGNSETLNCPTCGLEIVADHNSAVCHRCRKLWPLKVLKAIPSEAELGKCDCCGENSVVRDKCLKCGASQRGSSHSSM